MAKAEGGLAASVSGAGGKIGKFLRSKAVLTMAEFSAGAAAGAAVAEILKLGPGQEASIVVLAQSALGLSRLLTKGGARVIEAAEGRFYRFARLSASLAGDKGLAGALRGIGGAAGRIQKRPFVIGLSVGILGHSFYETLSGHPSIIQDVSSAEATPEPVGVSTETPASVETPTVTDTSAARQAAEASAATSVGITGSELAGGTVWGNELEFVQQLPNISHDAPVANALKNFAGIFAQPQAFTEIGPTDKAFLVNRDVAAWIAGRLDQVIGQDPNTLTGIQKTLWETGVVGIKPGWEQLAEVIKAYVAATGH